MSENWRQSSGVNLALGIASVAGIVSLATGRVGGSAARVKTCACPVCREDRPGTAYHGIGRGDLDAIRRTGLRGHPEHGDGWLYFSNRPESVISGGYGNTLLSFPWPRDAQPSPDGWSHRVRGTIDPRTIDLWYGETDAESPADIAWTTGDPYDADTWRRLGAIDPADLVGSRAVDPGPLRSIQYQTRYFHVTQAENVPTILREGLRGSDGICGFGVYLWDSLEYAEEMVDNEGGVILVVDPGDARLARCRAKDVEREGDADYYDHVAIVRTRPGRTWRPASTCVRRGSAARAAGQAPGLRLVEGPSPLTYPNHRYPMQRLSLVDPAAPSFGGPDEPSEMYFSDTFENQKKNPETGRAWKVPRKIPVPGAGPHVVGFLDYHVLVRSGPTGTPDPVYLDYYSIRRDQREKGLGTRLIDAFYRKFHDAAWIDWGTIAHDHAMVTHLRMRGLAGTPGIPKSYGKRW